MIENYKELLLKYLTGNIDKEDKNTTLNYETTITGDTTFMDSNYVVRGYVDMTDSNGQYNGKTVVYGYIGSIRDYHSFIALFENENIIMLKNTYSTGTEMGLIYTLEKDEKGQLYGIEYYNDKPRFIMLNNITEPNTNGNYEVILRQSYYLQGSILDGFNANPQYNPVYSDFVVGKSTQSSIYVFLLLARNAEDTSMVLSGTSLTINVGSANEWADYSITAAYEGGGASNIEGKYIYFDSDDNPHIEVYIYESLTNNLNVYKNHDLEIDTKENIYTNVGTALFGTGGHLSVVVGITNNMINLAPNKWYWFAQGYIEPYGGKKVCCIVNNNKEVCFSKETPSTGTFSMPYGVLRLINNQPIMYVRFPDDTGNTLENQYIGLIPEPNQTVQYIKQLPNCNTGGSYTPIVIVGNIYNLYNFIVLYEVYNTDHYDTKYSNWQIVYNPLNYNFEPYENVDSLIANNGMLYDTNNKLIFARNLYNYKVYNNRTISVLNVPNTLLNNTTIAKEELLSKTNSKLIGDTQSITKNIYENLFINMFITLNMENRNEDIYIENKAGAIALNQSAFKNADYDNSKATKIKIYYDDGNKMTTSTIATITNGVATYSIITYIPANTNIEKIEILSEDENIIYQTIANETILKLGLESNKYYRITQDVHIE